MAGSRSVADEDHQSVHRRAPHQVSKGSPCENRPSRHGQRTETIDHTSREILGESYCRVGRTENHRLHEDSGQKEVDVLDSRDRNRPAEHEREQQQEHDRLDGGDHQELRHPEETSKVALRDDQHVLEGMRRRDS